MSVLRLNTSTFEDKKVAHSRSQSVSEAFENQYVLVAM